MNATAAVAGQIPAHVANARAFRARLAAHTASGTPQAWLRMPQSPNEAAALAGAVAGARAFRARMTAHVASAPTHA
jgi:hypothetical protein